MNNFIKYGVVFCLFFVCCKHSWKNFDLFDDEIIDSTATRIIVAPIDENMVIKFSDVFDSISFIRLETNKRSLIGQIEKIIATDDKFIILDGIRAKMVFVFDENGNFLNQVGSVGGGPEEYDMPLDIAYDKYNDELLILDSYPNRIMKFKLDGTFVDAINIDWRVSSIFVMADNEYLLYLNNRLQRNRTKNDYNIIVINNKGENLSNLLPYDKKTGQLSPPSLNVFSTFENNIMFSPYYSNKILNVDFDKINVKYYLDYGENKIPSSLLYNVNNGDLRKRIDMYEQFAYNAALSVETFDHIVNRFVYKRMIFTCFYSKESQTSKNSAIYFNDMYGLASSVHVYGKKEDLLLCVVDPELFTSRQKTLKNIKQDKNLLLSQINSFVPSLVVSNRLRSNMRAAVESSNITISDEEIDFINSIKEDDNPLIMIAKLKKF